MPVMVAFVLKTFTMKIKNNVPKVLKFCLYTFGIYYKLLKGGGSSPLVISLLVSIKHHPHCLVENVHCPDSCSPRRCIIHWNIVGMIFDAVVSLEECVCGF